MQDYLLIRGYPFYRDFKALEMTDQVDQQEHIIDGTVHGNTTNEEMPNSKCTRRETRKGESLFPPVFPSTIASATIPQLKSSLISF